MDDIFIIQEFSNKHGQISTSKCRETWLNKHLDIKEYLLNRFSKDEFISFTFVLQRIFNKVEKLPICENCGCKIFKADGESHRWCSVKCQLTDPKFIEWRSENLDEESRLKHWRENFNNKTTEEKQLSIEKQKQSKIEKYGENYVEVFHKKAEQTNIKKYGCANPFQNESVKEKAKQTFLNKYGTEWVSQSIEVKEKINATKRQNHTFNSSKAEDEFYQQLVNKFGEKDVKRQYSSPQYPFNCDFYIQSKDLYIECNFHWTHGGHPFNPNSTADQEQINYWQSKNSKYYNNAINVWSAKDPNKRIFAKQNHLNYIELFESTDIDNFLLSV